jgi:hypothetical protein
MTLHDFGPQPGHCRIAQRRPAVRLALTAQAGKTRVAFDGTVVPADIQSVKGALHLQGPDHVEALSDRAVAVAVDAALRSARQSLARRRAMDLRRHRRNRRRQRSRRRLHGRCLRQASGDGRQARLARRFDYNDLGGFVGLPPGNPDKKAKTTEQKQEVQKNARPTIACCPTSRFPLVKLRDHDVDLEFSGKSVKWQRFPLDNLRTHMILKNGVMHFAPLDLRRGRRPCRERHHDQCVAARSGSSRQDRSAQRPS